jgi:hypothetical protein
MGTQAITVFALTYFMIDEVLKNEFIYPVRLYDIVAPRAVTLQRPRDKQIYQSRLVTAQ